MSNLLLKNLCRFVKNEIMENLTQDKWRELLSSTSDAEILDVRTPEECEEGIVPNAKTLNILDPSAFMEGLEKLDKNKTYFIYCRSGNRSGQACTIMDQNGFKATYNLVGGMMEWNGELV